MWWFVRVLFSTLFLLSVVLSVPLAFDLGGRDAGLAYSLGLFLYYGAYSSIKLAVRLATTPNDDEPDDAALAAARERVRWAVAASLRLSQWIVLPTLLLWALSRFAVDAGSTDWVARTVAHVTGGEGSDRIAAAAATTTTATTSAAHFGQRIAGFFANTAAGHPPTAPLATTTTSASTTSFRLLGGWLSSKGASSNNGITSSSSSSWGAWLLGRGGVVESALLGGWDKSLRYSSPIFQLLEGFCTLLVIQAAGQITRWLVNRGRTDTWVIVLLAFSGSVLASAVYFLSRVVRFPQVDNVDAILIGVTVTSAVFLSAYGIGSGRGNPVESSLLFAYIVLCVYQIFTDYQPSTPSSSTPLSTSTTSSPPTTPPTAARAPVPGETEFPPLPPVLMASYATVVHLLGRLPTAVSSAAPRFVAAALQTVTPSVLIALTYRIIVFYCATRIIPAVRESGARALLQEPTLEDLDSASKLLGFLSWYSASILIAIYTSLLLQHFSVIDASAATASAAASSTAATVADGWLLQAGDYARGIPWRWVNTVGVMVLYAVEMYLGNDDLEGGLTNHWKMD